MSKDFISLKDLSKEEIYSLFKLTEKIKAFPSRFKGALADKNIGLLFEKPSLRTKVSFQVGIHRLGGKSIYLSSKEVQLGKREAVSDVAKTLSRYLDGVILRTFSHATFLEFAKNSKIPVINGLTDLLHPTQVLSDLYTIFEYKKALKKIKISFIGDGNNVCNSLIFGAAKLGLKLFIANPLGFEPKEKIISQALRISKKSGAKIKFFNEPEKVAKNADVLYTDVWASMGKEEEANFRREAFRGFQVNSNILKLAKEDCLVMHCLPAHREEEITSEVIDSKNSIVFKQAENRLFVQKALLVWLFKKGQV